MEETIKQLVKDAIPETMRPVTKCDSKIVSVFKSEEAGRYVFLRVYNKLKKYLHGYFELTEKVVTLEEENKILKNEINRAKAKNIQLLGECRAYATMTSLMSGEKGAIIFEIESRITNEINRDN